MHRLLTAHSSELEFPGPETDRFSLLSSIQSQGQPSQLLSCQDSFLSQHLPTGAPNIPWGSPDHFHGGTHWGGSSPLTVSSSRWGGRFSFQILKGSKLLPQILFQKIIRIASGSSVLRETKGNLKKKIVPCYTHTHFTDENTNKSI